MSPPQTLDTLAEGIVGLVGRDAADQIWRHFNPTPERVGEHHRIMPNSWKRPDYWPAVLREALRG